MQHCIWGPAPVSRFGHRYFCDLRRSADDGRPRGLFGRTSKVVTVAGGGTTATKVFETDDGDACPSAVDIPSCSKRHLPATTTDRRTERSERRADHDATVALLLLLLFIIINSTRCARSAQGTRYQFSNEKRIESERRRIRNEQF